ncbi:MAG TPA: glutamine synthetase [Candidatus Cloacimonetes bacterium]|nr:glutamine synthetase [Candidatus Cloacimonadota bacterium]HEX37981.1 glutamine synthetase [Candidatus Cloacimonadota bacterium]
MDKHNVLKKVEEEKVKFILLQFSDIYGVVKSITIPVNHLESSLDRGTWFDGSSIEGFARIAESDMYLIPDPNTYSFIPWLQSDDGNTARLICDVYGSDGKPFEGDPRYILKSTLKEAEDMGYFYKTGPEIEFFLLKKDGGLHTLPHDKAGYFDLTMDQAYEIRREMTSVLQMMGINVEATHHEVGIGQHEIDFRYDHALKTADNATTIRFTLKAIAQKYNLMATFMPKPLAGINGNGMHVHQSLFDSEGNNVFYDDNNPYHLSQVAFHFLAGQLRHIKGMTAILNPIVNSYKRLVSGYEAPVYISWARTNRSSLIRIPKYLEGRPQSTRLELRNPDPSCNIYLAFAVMLKAGLEGIKDKIDPPEPVEEDVYNFSDARLEEMKIDTLPGSLLQALYEMKRDDLIKNTLGAHTYERYLEAKNKEWNEFRIQVTEWELERYLEMY